MNKAQKSQLPEIDMNKVQQSPLQEIDMNKVQQSPLHEIDMNKAPRVGANYANAPRVNEQPNQGMGNFSSESVLSGQADNDLFQQYTRSGYPAANFPQWLNDYKQQVHESQMPAQPRSRAPKSLLPEINMN